MKKHINKVNTRRLFNLIAILFIIIPLHASATGNNPYGLEQVSHSDLKQDNLDSFNYLNGVVENRNTMEFVMSLMDKGYDEESLTFYFTNKIIESYIKNMIDEDTIKIVNERNVEENLSESDIKVKNEEFMFDSLTIFLTDTLKELQKEKDNIDDMYKEHFDDFYEVFQTNTYLVGLYTGLRTDIDVSKLSDEEKRYEQLMIEVAMDTIKDIEEKETESFNKLMEDVAQ